MFCLKFKKNIYQKEVYKIALIEIFIVAESGVAFFLDQIHYLCCAIKNCYLWGKLFCGLVNISNFTDI